MTAPVDTQPGATTVRAGETEGRQDWPVLLAAGIAVLTAIPVIRGKLEALALVCVVAGPFILRRFKRDRLVGVLSLTLGLWLVGQLVSDMWNGLGPRLSMQFVTAVTILCTVPVLLVLGRRDFDRIRVIVAGVAAGLALESLLVEHASIAQTT